MTIYILLENTRNSNRIPNSKNLFIRNKLYLEQFFKFVISAGVKVGVILFMCNCGNGT